MLKVHLSWLYVKHASHCIVCRKMHFCTVLKCSCHVLPLLGFWQQFQKAKGEEAKIAKNALRLTSNFSCLTSGKSRNWEKLETQTGEIRFKPVKVLPKFRLWQMMIVWPALLFQNWHFYLLTLTFGKGRTNCAHSFFANENLTSILKVWLNLQNYSNNIKIYLKQVDLKSQTWAAVHKMHKIMF